MSNTKAIIYTNTDQTKNLVFYDKDIIALSTNTKAIENPTTPEFNIFPNSGALVVKDANLDIYNRALNGEFDEFRYKVEFYFENKLFATHIINERPKYDYEAKTCTFYLGNAIDNSNTLPYKGYKYPLSSQSLDVVFYNLLKEIYNISDEDYEEIVGQQAGKYKSIDNVVYNSTTYKEYFNSIIIVYPYLSQTTAREALKTILLIAQCGMVLDKNNKFKLIRLDGYTTTDTLLEKTYMITPSDINQGFVPSVMLDNKFNNINLNYNVVSNEYKFNELVYNTTRLKENLSLQTFDVNNNEESLSKQTSYAEMPTSLINSKYLHGFVQQKINTISTTAIQSNISFNQKNNLIYILGLLNEYDDSNKIINPSITLMVRKKTIIYDGILYPEYGETAWAFTETAINSKKEEILSLNVDDVLEQEKLQKTFSATVNDKEYTFSLECKSTIEYVNTSSISNMDDIANIKVYMANVYLLVEKTFENIYGSIITDSPSLPTSSLSAIKEKISYEIIQVELSYNGDYKEIIFNKNVKSFGELNTNEFTLQQPLEMFQDTSFENINNTLTNDNIANNLLNVFGEGVHTGELTVIQGDYNTYYSKYSNLQENLGGFSVQYMSPVRKTLTNIVLPNLPKKVIVRVFGSETTYKLKDNKYEDILYRITFNENNNELTFEYFGSATLGWRISSCIVKYDIDESSEIGTNLTQRPFFEMGDKVIVCKDNNGTPIVTRNNDPVVYQVIDNNISIEGGAAFQRLKLREVKEISN